MKYMFFSNLFSNLFCRNRKEELKDNQKANPNAQPEALPKPKDVALVLSSGGARGLAHIGAIEELEARGYHIRSIAGCSMGALIGGVYAAGKMNEFREWMKTVNRKKMFELTDFSFSFSHIVKGERIIRAIKEFVPDVPIESLPIPYCAVATELKTGEEIIIDHGSLFDAIRASISIPSFYQPVQHDDMILIDGGIINPFPLNRVARQSGDILVGVDVSGCDYKTLWEENHHHTWRHKGSPSLKDRILDKLIPDTLDYNYYTMFTRSSSLMIRQNSILMAQLMHPDILVDAEMGRYGIFDFYRSEEIIAVGRQTAAEAITRFESNPSTSI